MIIFYILILIMITINLIFLFRFPIKEKKETEKQEEEQMSLYKQQLGWKDTKNRIKARIIENINEFNENKKCK